MLLIIKKMRRYAATRLRTSTKRTGTTCHGPRAKVQISEGGVSTHEGAGETGTENLVRAHCCTLFNQ